MKGILLMCSEVLQVYTGGIATLQENKKQAQKINHVFCVICNCQGTPQKQKRNASILDVNYFFPPAFRYSVPCKWITTIITLSHLVKLYGKIKLIETPASVANWILLLR